MNGKFFAVSVNKIMADTGKKGIGVCRTDAKLSLYSKKSCTNGRGYCKSSQMFSTLAPLEGKKSIPMKSIQMNELNLFRLGVMAFRS